MHSVAREASLQLVLYQFLDLKKPETIRPVDLDNCFPPLGRQSPLQRTTIAATGNPFAGLLRSYGLDQAESEPLKRSLVLASRWKSVLTGQQNEHPEKPFWGVHFASNYIWTDGRRLSLSCYDVMYIYIYILRAWSSIKCLHLTL